MPSKTKELQRLACKKWRLKNLDYYRYYNNMLRAMRREDGLCVDCSRNSEKFYRCLDCRIKANKRKKKNASH